MMISLEELKNKYNLNIKGVLHIGAHVGEEAESYQQNGVSHVWWVEGNKDLIDVLRKNVTRYNNNYVINSLVYKDDLSTIDFNIADWDMGMCSSILDWGTHKEKAPFVNFVESRSVQTRTIDSLVEEFGISDCNFMNLDIQGAELLALMGAEKFLTSVDYIFTEVNFDELYKDCVRIWDLDNWLYERGFVRVETLMAAGAVMWGDALYIRKPS